MYIKNVLLKQEIQLYNCRKGIEIDRSKSAALFQLQALCNRKGKRGQTQIETQLTKARPQMGQVPEWKPITALNKLNVLIFC